MINVAIYGCMKYSLKMKDLLEENYPEIRSLYFVVDNPLGENEISIKSFIQKYSSGELVAIVIPKEYYLMYNALIQELLKGGVNVNDIYNGMRISEYKTASKDSLLITPMLKDSYLSYLEYHVADHCNLNCKFCTHYSPLVSKPVYTDFEEFKVSLNKFKEYIDDVGVIRILGGEPLLNPMLPEFVEYTRKLFRNSIITVVTNGMLLDRISKELIDTMKKCVAFFHISFYPPFEEKADSVKKMLVENEIAFTITPKIEAFDKINSLEKNGDEDFFYSCFQATCTCLHKGKIAPCYAPFTTKYFNEAFNQELPTDEGIDLFDEENTTEDIKLKLLYPLKRCDYCINGGSYPWEIVGKDSKLEDWI